MKWIPVGEKLPKIKQSVLLSLTDGQVLTGYREVPDVIWLVTEPNGREHWVYDPDSYTDDIESLPEAKDVSFSKDDYYTSEGWLSVTSPNYEERFTGVNAWAPIPEAYKEPTP